MLASLIDSIADDWLSDYEVQADYQAEQSLSAADAFARMVPELAVWIRQGALVPGDMLNGFVVWPGDAEVLSDRFAAAAAAINVVERPGQICWFDLGPSAPGRAHES